MYWDQLRAQISLNKMIHIATDGGARPNPGNAGWSALIRRNGKFTYNFGHYDHASNNAMEIDAVIEALRIIPAGMHVWISTDSAYVKNWITQWLPNWMKNNWRINQGKPVANKSLWQKLWEVAQMHQRNNNNTFTWSGPSGVLGCTGQRPLGRVPGGADGSPLRVTGNRVTLVH
jgi:ribonuclease HI